MSRTRVLLVTTMFLLLAAACGDDTDTDSGDDATVTVPAPADEPSDVESGDESGTTTVPAADQELERFASYEGVTADTIRIGVVWSDLDALRELGLVDINYGDIPLVWQTLIDDINANGGVLGRELEMVFEQYNPVINATIEEACVKLTQDEKVFAVVGSLAGPAIESILCFVDINETILVAGTHRPDLLERARAPWITTGWSQDRRYAELLDLYEQEGLLEGRLAYFDTSPEHDGLTERVLLPALDALGKEIVTPLTHTGPAGDEVALAQQVEVFAERLEQDDIDTLLIVQSQIALGLPLMREAGFDGTILTIDSGSFLSGLGSFDEREPEVYEGTYGPTGFSSDDVWAMESTLECVQSFTAANPGIEVIPSSEVPQGEPQWASVIIPACRFLQVFTTVAEGAGVDLNPETFQQAAFGLGSFELPGQPFNSLSEGKLDADDGIGLGVFDATIGEFGGLRPITPYQSATGD